MDNKKLKPMQLRDLLEGDVFCRFGFTPSLPWHKQLDTQMYVRGHKVSLGMDAIKCSAVDDCRMEIFLKPDATVYVECS